VSDATTLEFVAKFRDDLTVPAGKAEDALKKIGDTAGKDAAKGLEKFGQGLSDAAQKIPGVTSSLGGLNSALSVLADPLLLLPAALVGGAVASAHLAEANEETVVHLKHLSSATGLTVNELFGLRGIAKPLGLDIDSVSAAVSRMEANLGKNSKAVQKMGIDTRDPIEALAQLADRFKGSEDPMERAKMATTLLGRSWRELSPLLEEGGEAIRKIEGTNKVSDEDVERYERMHRAQIATSKEWASIKFEIGQIASGPMEALLEKTAKWLKMLKPDKKDEGSAANILDALDHQDELRMRGWSASNTGAQNRAIIEDWKKTRAADELMKRGEDAAGRKFGGGDSGDENERAAEEAAKRLQAVQDQITLGALSGQQREETAVRLKYSHLIEEDKDYAENVAAYHTALAQELKGIGDKWKSSYSKSLADLTEVAKRENNKQVDDEFRKQKARESAAEAAEKKLSSLRLENAKLGIRMGGGTDLDKQKAETSLEYDAKIKDATSEKERALLIDQKSLQLAILEGNSRKDSAQKELAWRREIGKESASTLVELAKGQTTIAAVAENALTQAAESALAAAIAWAVPAALASTATMGGAATTGASAITIALETVKAAVSTPAKARGGIAQGTIIGGEYGRAELFTPAVPGTVYTHSETTNHVGGSTINLTHFGDGRQVAEWLAPHLDRATRIKESTRSKGSR
jgi:hypothetical protein